MKEGGGLCLWCQQRRVAEGAGRGGCTDSFDLYKSSFGHYCHLLELFTLVFLDLRSFSTSFKASWSLTVDMSTSRVRVGVVTASFDDDDIDHLELLGELEVSYMGLMIY